MNCADYFADFQMIAECLTFPFRHHDRKKMPNRSCPFIAANQLNLWMANAGLISTGNRFSAHCPVLQARQKGIVQDGCVKLVEPAV
jgi:hypothetical protein